MKEFRVLITCNVCGENFDSEYERTKHTSRSHPQPEKTGWLGGEDAHICSCGGHEHNYHE